MYKERKIQRKKDTKKERYKERKKDTYRGHKPNLYKDGLQPTKTLDNAADVQAENNIEARGNSEAIRQCSNLWNNYHIIK